MAWSIQPSLPCALDRLCYCNLCLVYHLMSSLFGYPVALAGPHGGERGPRPSLQKQNILFSTTKNLDPTHEHTFFLSSTMHRCASHAHASLHKIDNFALCLHCNLIPQYHFPPSRLLHRGFDCQPLLCCTLLLHLHVTGVVCPSYHLDVPAMPSDFDHQQQFVVSSTCCYYRYLSRDVAVLHLHGSMCRLQMN